MVRTLDANQIQKIDRSYNRPVYFAHLLLDGLTLYFSDRSFNYNGHEYESYLLDFSNIGNEIQNLGGADNATITLRFKNQGIRDKATLIELFDDYPPEKKYVEIYKLFWDSGETFGSDVSTKIFKGEIGQPYDVYDPPVDFKIDCSLMLFGKNASLPLDVISLVEFPLADPDDVGKHRNIPYGSIAKLVCPWTVAGWLSTLTADITDAATSFDVTEASASPAVPFTAIIDNEQVRVTARSGNSFTAVTRHYGGTTAVSHNKGANIYEQRSDFEAEVAKYPVKSIGDVYIKKGSLEWLRVISGVTKNVSIGGRATLVFSDKVKTEQKTVVLAQTTTNTMTTQGSHPHGASTGGNTIKKCIPSGGDSAVIDGNEESAKGWSGTGGATATFSEANLGAVVKQYCWVKLGVASSTKAVSCGGTALGNTAAVTGWQRFAKTGGNWNDNVVVSSNDGGSVAEIYKEIEYTPTVTVAAHAADGVNASSSSTTTLWGNSVANMVIGDLVACDVEGIPDDASGTYTGTPNALIERPDHVRKHILMALLGFAAGDIGSSFDTVGAVYAARILGGYKFAFNLPDVATETMALFEAMDLQSRTNMFESGGQFKLAFGLTTGPTSQKTFDKNNIKGSFKFGKLEVADLKNKIIAHHFRDYSKSGSLGEMYQKVVERSSGTADLLEEMGFNCIGDLATMVGDVLDWCLIEKINLKRTVEFSALWEAIVLEHGDYFTVNSTFWSGLKFKTIKLLDDPETQTIEIFGLEFLYGATILKDFAIPCEQLIDLPKDSAFAAEIKISPFKDAAIPVEFSGAVAPRLLLENGDFLLLESGDKILMEY